MTRMIRLALIKTVSVKTVSLSGLAVVLVFVMTFSATSFAEDAEDKVSQQTDDHEIVYYPWKKFYSDDEAKIIYSRLLRILISKNAKARNYQKSQSPKKHSQENDAPENEEKISNQKISNQKNSIQKDSNHDDQELDRDSLLEKFSKYAAEKTGRDLSFVNLVPDAIIFGGGFKVSGAASGEINALVVVLPVVSAKIDRKTDKVISAGLTFRTDTKLLLGAGISTGELSVYGGVGPVWNLNNEIYLSHPDQLRGNGIGGSIGAGSVVGVGVTAHGGFIGSAKGGEFFYFFPTIDGGVNTGITPNFGYRGVFSLYIPGFKFVNRWIEKKVIPVTTIEEELSQFKVKKLPKRVSDFEREIGLRQ